MGLDNGCLVKSNHRKITRSMLPKEIKYPFNWGNNNDKDIEIIYHRKDWGLRNEIVYTFPLKEDSDWQYVIDTPTQIFELIRIIVSFMNKKTWEEKGDSIWEYDEILPILQRDVINLAIIAGFMENNPDVYLEFYDSY